MGISAGHIVVGLDEIERGADHRFTRLELGAAVCGNAGADLRAGDGERVERRARIAHHRVDIERTTRLIEGPESFGAIGVECGQVSERRVREIARGEARLIERAQQRERIEARPFEPRAQIGRGARRLDASWTA